MSKLVQLILSPENASDETAILKLSGSLAGIASNEISVLRIIRRSVDARKKDILVNLTIELFTENDLPVPGITPFRPQNVVSRPEVIIVGAGPAGLFAALRLIELGIRPVILERGKDITAR